MIEASATAHVERTSREVLEFVLDLDRYREVDTKIGRVSRAVSLDETGSGTARYWGKLRGLPPAPDTNVVRLIRWSEVTFTGAPRQPGRLVLEFQGRFRCVDTDQGCEVTHDYRLTFRRPFRWIYEPLLADWLQDEVTDEVGRLATALSPTPARSTRAEATNP